ncbi:hypothetical protein [Microbacterium sp. MYb64]|uniref:hypothetical protein n=1 Tax=Microbacterium sp. MYb64 TaxID=1848691 RepID=UPI000CFBA97C|nr:hypothetical protein [Microbacterium sp. MYb64]PRB06444.1 hypothetical protein CQ044_09020 [Microbacterium sp. MYb64]
MSKTASARPSRMATAGFIFGAAACAVAILTVALFIVPSMGMALLSTTLLGGIVVGVLAIVAIILSAVAILRDSRRRWAVMGIVLSLIAVGVAVVGYVQVFGLRGLG